MAGLLFSDALTGILGFTKAFILIVSAVTLSYGLAAIYLATRRTPPVRLLRALITANWVWTLVSVILLIGYYDHATLLGKAFLILQILVVGGLAYLEGRRMEKGKAF